LELFEHGVFLVWFLIMIQIYGKENTVGETFDQPEHSLGEHGLAKDKKGIQQCKNFSRRYFFGFSLNVRSII
jgi:hypothetical protein